MAEYIEKEAFKRELFKVAITDDLYGMGVASGINIAVEKLNATPAADVVEVVRCKDCIHNVANWRHDELDATDYSDITCDYFMTDGMESYDFCSYGERKQ